ncbi:hypothetical protein OROGR_023787 [Orobanche gracilis]
MVAQKTRILVQSQSHQLQCRPGSDKSFKVEEYHIVDLDGGKIYRNISPPMLIPARVGMSSMVTLGDSVYMFGRCFSPDDIIQIPSCKAQSPKDTFYTGAAHLKIVNHDDGQVSGFWREDPEKIFGPLSPSCTSLNGKIYSFGFGYFCPRVFDPTTKCWNAIPFPKEFERCRVAVPVLPDAYANRIILRLQGSSLPSSPSVYAFYHTDNIGILTPLVTECVPWSPYAAFADDVIYFHYRKCPNLLCAYDLKGLQWLDVKWATTDIDGWNILDFRCELFEDLHSLGDKSFCLATSWSVLPKSVYTSDPNFDLDSDDSDYDGDDDDIRKCRFLFLKFRVERTGSTVNLVPQSVRSFVLPRTSYARNMVPIS